MEKLLMAWMVLLLLIGCNKKFSTAGPGQRSVKLDLDKPAALNKIAFLTFSVNLKDSLTDNYEFKLKEAIFSEGELKKPAFREEMAIEPYFFYYEVSDGNKKNTNLVRVQNPLETAFEYTEESGAFNKKVVRKQVGEVFIRFQFSAGSKFISIYKPSNNSLQLKRIYYATL